jgi:hypothetical protein
VAGEEVEEERMEIMVKKRKYRKAKGFYSDNRDRVGRRLRHYPNPPQTPGPVDTSVELNDGDTLEVQWEQQYHSIPVPVEWGSMGYSTHLGRYLGTFIVLSPPGTNLGFGRQRTPLVGERTVRPSRESKFSEEVLEKAWGMVEEFMDYEQWQAFYYCDSTVELTNKAGTHRLLINKSGDFRMLKGAIGAGIEVTSGRVYESKYPLGDELAALIALFRYDTPRFLRSWKCGNFSSRNVRQQNIGDQSRDDRTEEDRREAVIQELTEAAAPVVGRLILRRLIGWLRR